MLWSDLAEWVGPTVNCGDGDRIANEPGDRVVDHMYVVLHIAEGTYAGTIAWQRNPTARVSSHFIVARDGRCAQMVDTGIRAWTQGAGNPYSISIEFEGYVPAPLTAAQVEVAARILARAHQVHRIPLQVTDRVGVRGLGHHSMGAESGAAWGHSQCPGVNIKAQKPLIVARATQLAGGAGVLAGGDDMLMLIRQTGRPEVYLTDLMGRWHITSEEQLARVQAQLRHPGHWAAAAYQGGKVAEVADLADFGPDLTHITAPPVPPPAEVDEAAIAARVAQQVSQTLLSRIDDATERAVRRVLGAVDGATPAAG